MARLPRWLDCPDTYGLYLLYSVPGHCVFYVLYRPCGSKCVLLGFAYQQADVPTSRPTCLPAGRRAYQQAEVPTSRPTCLPAGRRAYQQADVPTSSLPKPNSLNASIDGNRPDVIVNCPAEAKSIDNRIKRSVKRPARRT